jgi:peptide deformylase
MLIFCLIPLFGAIQAEPVSKFIPPHDHRLTEKCAEIPMSEIRTKEIQNLIDIMFKIASPERDNDEKSVLVGLAAPQIGILKQVILVDVGFSSNPKSLGELKAFINPRLIEKSTETVMDSEGCFSVDGNICGVVPRAKTVKISAYDREGNKIVEEYSDMTARIFQHEVDHLEGKRFPDRVGQNGPEHLHWVEESDYPEYRLNWKEWNKILTWEGWLAMKAGKPYAPKKIN